jgi:hypothetical protein
MYHAWALRNANSIFVRITEGKRLCFHWRILNWILLVQERNQRWVLVNMVMNP